MMISREKNASTCLELSGKAFEEEVMFELPLNGLGVYLPVKGQGELVGR